MANMRNEIKLSVIMPSLNVCKYISESLDSVCSQTLQEIEILCIDAGSTDGTYEILKEKAAQDGRIMLIQSKRKSYGQQVNLGLRKALGKYVAILETDDYVRPTMYEELYEKAERFDCDYVKCDYDSYWTQRDGNRFFVRNRIAKDTFYNKIFTPRKEIDYLDGDWFLWNGVYKRVFLVRNRIFFSETSGAAFQDIGFLHQVSAKAERCLYHPNALYCYCTDREGASSNMGKDLQFIWQEYSRLYGQMMQRDDAPEEEWRLLYKRMGKSLVLAYRSGFWEMDEAERNRYYQWFRKQLLEAESSGRFRIDDLPQSHRESYRKLLDSQDTWLQDRIKKRMELLQFVGEQGQYPLVIFGCGSFGHGAHRSLRKNGYELTAFSDNNEKLWGTRIDETPVFAPQALAELSEDTRFVIANAAHAGKIHEQIVRIRTDKVTKCFFYTPENSL